MPLPYIMVVQLLFSFTIKNKEVAPCLVFGENVLILKKCTSFDKIYLQLKFGIHDFIEKRY